MDIYIPLISSINFALLHIKINGLTCATKCFIRIFYKCTKLAILELLLTLYSHIFEISLTHLQHVMLVNMK